MSIHCSFLRHALRRALPLAATTALLAGCGTTAEPPGCLGNAEIAAIHADLQASKQVAAPQLPSLAAAECTRAKLNALQAKTQGRVVGFKAGLTNPAVQKRFNHDAPVRGTLYERMLLADGASVPAAFGARPVYEADLLVRVRDAAVNSARTPEQVLAAIDQVIPFIELPDLAVIDPSKLNGNALVALNVAARLGVVGTPIAVQRTQAFSDALRDMQVTLSADGAEIDRGKGSDVLGHPLAAVIWLAQDLAREGKALQPGDLVSLGSFSKLVPPKPGQAIAVGYQGLPGNPVVRLTFK